MYIDSFILHSVNGGWRKSRNNHGLRQPTGNEGAGKADERYRQCSLEWQVPRGCRGGKYGKGKI